MKRVSPEFDWPSVIYNHASALERQGCLKEASELFSIVLDVTQDAELQSGAHYSLGRIAKSAANEKLANEHFHKAMLLNPGRELKTGESQEVTGKPRPSA